MAHVLVGIGDFAIRAMVAEVLEQEGHAVTVPKDFWAALGMLRSTLHPLVVVYRYDGYVLEAVEDAEHVQSLTASFGELKRHASVQISWGRGPLPSPLHGMSEQVITEGLPGPPHLEALLAAVDRAAARLAERDGSGWANKRTGESR